MSSESLYGFINQQESRGRQITPELRQVAAELSRKEEAQRRYRNRDIWCKAGLHSRRQAWSGGGYPGTCVKCWREYL